MRGYDVYPALVNRARHNGIDASLIDLDAESPKGELAVMWGVLHHLNDRDNCLKRIGQNYSLAFIREPLKYGTGNGMEMGKPLIKEEVEDMVGKYLPNAEISYFNNCVFIFYKSPDVKLF